MADEWTRAEQRKAQSEQVKAIMDFVSMLSDKIAELEKENERLTVSYETLKLHDQEEIGILKSENAELKDQIEQMKCCENCKFRDCTKSNQYQTCWYCNNKDKWQLRR